jgi:hypothetical protein
LLLPRFSINQANDIGACLGAGGNNLCKLVFLSLDDARRKIEHWRRAYNRARPHSSLGYLAPEEFAASHSHLRSEPAARSAGSPQGRPSGALH